VPAAVRAVISRNEFATAYTPYQPEVSQGTLTHIFEFQTCICELTGMEVANASLYDGPSALAEAALMALRITRRAEVAVSAGIHPEARQVLATYASGPSIPLRTLALDPGSGATAPIPLGALPFSVAAVVVQQPNYLGIIEDLERLAETAHAAGALLVVAVNPTILGVLESPGALGADIVVGDAQVFGCPPAFGGPSVGFLACRDEHVRQMPGRLVSQTVDEDGRLCYTLTLQAREQHIRRARATSNVCSNQALSALAATVHLALLGAAGLKERGEICLRRAHYLRSLLCALPAVRPLVDGPFFHEFALRLPCQAEDFVSAMREKGIDPGVPLARLSRGRSGDADIPGVLMNQVLLVAVTELNPPEALNRYAELAVKALAVLDPAGSHARAETTAQRRKHGPPPRGGAGGQERDGAPESEGSDR
jgi:glycine dehydrogenase subunit 1